jgi:hypothetical protein
MISDLDAFVAAFARSVERADLKRPVAANVRSKAAFQPGIGPYSETEALSLIMREMFVDVAPGEYTLSVPYVQLSRQRCDLCLGIPPDWEWAVEVKMLRMMGDNGKPNDNMLMHILSPYPQHRSAVTDCAKLVASSLGKHKAVLIYGFESPAFPLEPAIRAFEALARDVVALGARSQDRFNDLIHPVHSRGAVYAWEVANSSDARAETF